MGFGHCSGALAVKVRKGNLQGCTHVGSTNIVGWKMGPGGIASIGKIMASANVKVTEKMHRMDRVTLRLKRHVRHVCSIYPAPTPRIPVATRMIKHI